MRLVAWDDSWSVGVEEIDRQHRKIVDMINRLETARANGQSATVIGAIMEEILQYTDYHFGLEELYFDEFKYADTDRHKAAHRALSVQARAFQRSLTQGHTNIGDEVTRFLQDWLAIHIKGSDQQYRECFAKNGLR